MTQLDPYDWPGRLAELEERGLRRVLRIVESPQGAHVTVSGRRLVCFCSNNYLGLANDPRIREAAIEATRQWGWGAGASRLIAGTMTPHRQLEEKLAAFKHTAAALVCSTGYQANLAAVRALAGKGDVVFLDKLNHASIIDAARGSGAVVRVFPHRDYGRLQRLLERTASARRRVIVTDSLFSMDGDLADLPRLVELKKRHEALLVIDEAHATGVVGPGGRGVAELQEVEGGIDLTVGTLSKALGGIGGFLAGAREVIDWVINTAGAFIYTTALPPPACAAAITALDIVEREPHRREHVLALAQRLRTALAERGFDPAGSQSQIVPIVVGSAERALAVAARLEADGLLAPAIRPPTVPTGRSRIRLSLCADHTDEDVDRLIASLDHLQ
ncbi:MAG TPA: 8-amino-7-oxononanoate synthase [Phycisphaerae bacterium]|nr:8-amino-7-oxononanoate synthase [Phycisphaerae bacterium]